VWSRDPYSTRLRLVLYGSLDHTPRSHKSHIELQTHIIYYVVRCIINTVVCNVQELTKQFVGVVYVSNTVHGK